MKDPPGNPNIISVFRQLALAVFGCDVRNLRNLLVEKSALTVAGTPSAVGVCYRISGGVMHHESACKSEFRVRFPEWGQQQGGAVVACWTHNPEDVGSIPTPAIFLIN